MHDCFVSYYSNGIRPNRHFSVAEESCKMFKSIKHACRKLNLFDGFLSLLSSVL